MTGPRDTTATNWARTVPRLRRNAEELRRYDFEVTEPDNLEVHPRFRVGATSAIVEVHDGESEGT